MLHPVAARDMYHLHVFVGSGVCNVSGRTSNKTILQYNTLCCYGTSSKHAYMNESVLSLGWAIEAHMQCDEEARGAVSVNHLHAQHALAFTLQPYLREPREDGRGMGVH